jgi:tRNA threonylcarbamoyladenosine biosynthesis protein TsaE
LFTEGTISVRRSVFQISSQAQSTQFGKILAGVLEPGDVVGLCGDLGAGKTFVAGAVAHALGVPEDTAVTSPTFTLIKEYQGRMPIYHMDLYRLGGVDELYDLGLWEYYDGPGVSLVEWSDRFDELWPDRALVLNIELLQGEKRLIEAKGTGRGGVLVERLSDGFIGTNV